MRAGVVHTSESIIHAGKHRTGVPVHIILNIASPLPRSQFQETSEALSLSSLFLSSFSKEGFKEGGFILHKNFKL